MVLRQVGKDSRIESAAGDTLRARACDGNFHHDGFAAAIEKVGQQALQIEAFRRGASGIEVGFLGRGAQSADDADAFDSRFRAASRRRDGRSVVLPLVPVTPTSIISREGCP